MSLRSLCIGPLKPLVPLFDCLEPCGWVALFEEPQGEHMLMSPNTSMWGLGVA